MNTTPPNQIQPDNVQIDSSWKAVLADEFTKPYFADIKSRLVADKQSGKAVYPPGKLIFNAFNHTPFTDVKVVIIGQDPYHQPNQAMGLSFSVPQGIRIPPSLNNIYKELAQSIDGFVIPAHGDLTAWATQGVFLLNAALTVEASKAGSHAKIGWQQFTDAVIHYLSEQRESVIFMLWGNFAKQKANLINTQKHHVLTAVHPSPLAGNRFLGCGHFAQANQYLIDAGQTPIDWQV